MQAFKLGQMDENRRCALTMGLIEASLLDMWRLKLVEEDDWMEALGRSTKLIKSLIKELSDGRALLEEGFMADCALLVTALDPSDDTTAADQREAWLAIQAKREDAKHTGILKAFLDNGYACIIQGLVDRMLESKSTEDAGSSILRNDLNKSMAIVHDTKIRFSAREQEVLKEKIATLFCSLFDTSVSDKKAYVDILLSLLPALKAMLDEFASAATQAFKQFCEELAGQQCGKVSKTSLVTSSMDTLVDLNKRASCCGTDGVKDFLGICSYKSGCDMLEVTECIEPCQEFLGVAECAVNNLQELAVMVFKLLEGALATGGEGGNADLEKAIKNYGAASECCQKLSKPMQAEVPSLMQSVTSKHTADSTAKSLRNRKGKEISDAMASLLPLAKDNMAKADFEQMAVRKANVLDKMHLMLQLTAWADDPEGDRQRLHTLQTVLAAIPSHSIYEAAMAHVAICQPEAAKLKQKIIFAILELDLAAIYNARLDDATMNALSWTCGASTGNSIKVFFEWLQKLQGQVDMVLTKACDQCSADLDPAVIEIETKLIDDKLTGNAFLEAFGKDDCIAVKKAVADAKKLADAVSGFNRKMGRESSPQVEIATEMINRAKAATVKWGCLTLMAKIV